MDVTAERAPRTRAEDEEGQGAREPSPSPPPDDPALRASMRRPAKPLRGEPQHSAAAFGLLPASSVEPSSPVHDEPLPPLAPDGAPARGGGRILARTAAVFGGVALVAGVSFLLGYTPLQPPSPEGGETVGAPPPGADLAAADQPMLPVAEPPALAEPPSWELAWELTSPLDASEPPPPPTERQLDLAADFEALVVENRELFVENRELSIENQELSVENLELSAEVEELESETLTLLEELLTLELELFSAIDDPAAGVEEPIELGDEIMARSAAASGSDPPVQDLPQAYAAANGYDEGEYVEDEYDEGEYVEDEYGYEEYDESTAFPDGPSSVELYASELAAVQSIDGDPAEGRALASAALGAPMERLVIADVSPGSAAEGAGLLPGDILLSVGGLEILGMEDIMANFDGSSGQLHELGIVRDGARFTVMLGDSPAYLPLRLDWVDPVFFER